MTHLCEVCGKPEQPPVYEGSAGRVRYVCPNNGKSVTCQVCGVTVPHRLEVLANRVPRCLDCEVDMVPAIAVTGATRPVLAPTVGPRSIGVPSVLPTRLSQSLVRGRHKSTGLASGAASRSQDGLITHAAAVRDSGED